MFKNYERRILIFGKNSSYYGVTDLSHGFATQILKTVLKSQSVIKIYKYKVTVKNSKKFQKLVHMYGNVRNKVDLEF